jgi:hypothetical protein
MIEITAKHRESGGHRGFQLIIKLMKKEPIEWPGTGSSSALHQQLQF